MERDTVARLIGVGLAITAAPTEVSADNNTPLNYIQNRDIDTNREYTQSEIQKIRGDFDGQVVVVEVAEAPISPTESEVIVTPEDVGRITIEDSRIRPEDRLLAETSIDTTQLSSIFNFLIENGIPQETFIPENLTLISHGEGGLVFMQRVDIPSGDNRINEKGSIVTVNYTTNEAGEQIIIPGFFGIGQITDMAMANGVDFSLTHDYTQFVDRNGQIILTDGQTRVGFDWKKASENLAYDRTDEESLALEFFEYTPSVEALDNEPAWYEGQTQEYWQQYMNGVTRFQVQGQTFPEMNFFETREVPEMDAIGSRMQVVVLDKPRLSQITSGEVGENIVYDVYVIPALTQTSSGQYVSVELIMGTPFQNFLYVRGGHNIFPQHTNSTQTNVQEFVSNPQITPSIGYQHAVEVTNPNNIDDYIMRFRSIYQERNAGNEFELMKFEVAADLMAGTNDANLDFRRNYQNNNLSEYFDNAPTFYIHKVLLNQDSNSS